MSSARRRDRLRFREPDAAVTPGVSSFMTRRLGLLIGLLAAVSVAGLIRLIVAPRPGPGAPAAREARSRVEQGNLLAAVSYWKQAVLLEPANGDYHGELGNAYLTQGNADLAAASLQMAAYFTPDRPHVFCQLAQALVEERRRDEALQILEIALTRTPDCPLALSVKGEQFLRDDNLKEALPAFQRVLQLQPEFALAYQKTGYILLSLHRLDEAEEVLKQGLKLSPGDPGIHALLGELYSQRPQSEGTVAAAERHFLQAMEGNPDKAKANTDLGRLYLRAGRVADAAKRYRAALDARPYMGDALYGMAQVARRQGRPQEAAQHLATLARGQRMERQVQDLRARAGAEKANVSIRLRIARLCLDHGLLKEAGRALDEALALAPENRRTRELRAEWYRASALGERAAREAAIANRLPRSAS